MQRSNPPSHLMLPSSSRRTSSPVNQQSGATTSDMAERFTDRSRDRMECPGQVGPSADNVRGHFTGTQSEPPRAPPALIEKKASPRLTTDGLDDARSMDGCAIGCSLTDYVWGKLKPALSGENSIRARCPTGGCPTLVGQDGLGDLCSFSLQLCTAGGRRPRRAAVLLKVCTSSTARAAAPERLSRAQPPPPHLSQP